MKFLKFVKNYLKIKKVINELEYRKELANVNIKKIDKLLEKSGATVAPYRRKKLEFYKGKYEGYTNSLLIIEKFIDTGNLPDIVEDI
jgi:hypothetical protein